MRQRIASGVNRRKKPSRISNPYLRRESFIAPAAYANVISTAEDASRLINTPSEALTPVAAPAEPPVTVEVIQPRPKPQATTQDEVRAILAAKPEDPKANYSQLSKQIAALSLIHTRRWSAHEVAHLFGWPVAQVDAWIILAKSML